MTTRDGLTILASTIASILGFAPPVVAADDATAARIEEIVVTAQRRAENLQDVPIAITVTSAEALERSGVTNAAEIEIVTPGLSFASVGSYAQPRIRGVGTSADAATLENPVAMYVDGVYYAHQAGSVLTLNNIEQVEVIKGPQGTLFGRNATGGLIQITTRRPTQESTGRFSVGYGNYDTFAANAYLAGGITDNLAADIAVYYRDQGDGYGVNRATGQDVQIMENLAARSKWILTPSDATTLTFIVDAARDDGAIALAPAPGTTALGGGTLLSAQDVDTPAPYKNRNEQAGASLTIEHSFSPFDFVSISAYRKNDDVVYFPNATNNPATMTLVTLDDDNFKQASQELQLLSNKDAAFSWTTGVYFFWSEGGWKPVGISGQPVAPLNSINISDTQKTTSAAIYGQGTIEVASDTNLTLGARYTWDKREWDGTVAFDAPFPIPSFSDDGELDYEKLTWRVALDHRFSPQVLGYISANRGFKSGGFNDSVVPAALYDPEELDAYEIGVKTQSADNRLRFNAAAYYYDYKNIQVARYQNGNIVIYNGAGAEIYGVDGDAAFQVTEQFSLSLGLSVLHNEYTEFPNADLTTPLPGGGTLFETGSAKGNKLSNTPDFTASVSADYSVPLSAGGVDLNLTYYYNDGWYGNPDNRLQQPSYQVLNALVAWKSSDDAWRVSVYGRNLLDEEYAVFLSAQANGDSFQYAPPLTYGITLERRF